jgi:hypothetical protein
MTSISYATLRVGAMRGELQSLLQGATVPLVVDRVTSVIHVGGAG